MSTIAPSPEPIAPTCNFDSAVAGADLLDSSMLPDLTCHICHDIFKNPRLACRRGHIYCGTCLLDWSNSEQGRSNACPDCRSPLLQPRPGVIGEPAPPIVANCVSMQRMNCPGRCGRVLRVSYIKQHVGVCCPNDVVDCPFAPYCAQRGKRCELEQHLKDNFLAHARISFEQAARATKELESLRESKALYDEKIKNLECRVDRLSEELHEANTHTHQLLASLIALLPEQAATRTRPSTHSAKRRRRRPFTMDGVQTVDSGLDIHPDAFNNDVGYSPSTPDWYPADPAETSDDNQGEAQDP